MTPGAHREGVLAWWCPRRLCLSYWCHRPNGPLAGPALSRQPPGNPCENTNRTVVPSIEPAGSPRCPQETVPFPSGEPEAWRRSQACPSPGWLACCPAHHTGLQVGAPPWSGCTQRATVDVSLTHQCSLSPSPFLSGAKQFVQGRGVASDKAESRGSPSPHAAFLTRDGGTAAITKGQKGGWMGGRTDGQTQGSP